MKMFEWDENKRLKNIETKSLDFIDAVVVFDGRVVTTAPSNFPFEDGFVSTAVLNEGKCYIVVWTWRGAVRRIISFRRARDGEERAYGAIFS